jgi:Co/Zn/Cd efflux system component
MQIIDAGCFSPHSLKTQRMFGTWHVCCEQGAGCAHNQVRHGWNSPHERWLRTALVLAASLNLSWFAAEFPIASWIGSVSLLADSSRFLANGLLSLLLELAGSLCAGRRRTEQDRLAIPE